MEKFPGVESIKLLISSQTANENVTSQLILTEIRYVEHLSLSLG